MTLKGPGVRAMWIIKSILLAKVMPFCFYESMSNLFEIFSDF